jgi:GAF domain-containing protein
VALAEYDSQPGRATPRLSELTHIQSHADEDDLLAGLTGLAEIVVDALTMHELLAQVAEFAAHAIPGADGAGVTLAHPSAARSGIRVWAVTPEFIRDIDTLQYHVHNEGPGITSMCVRRPRISGSLGDDTRWPRFGSAVAHLGVNSALSLPLVLRERVIGVINAYAYGLDAFNEHAVALGAKFARPAAVSVYNARLLIEARHRVEQLQRALDSRSDIDQAIGIIRGRSGASVEQAFGRLLKVSQSDNVRLPVMAKRLVEESVWRARARQDHT